MGVGWGVDLYIMNPVVRLLFMLVVVVSIELMNW